MRRFGCGDREGSALSYEKWRVCRALGVPHPACLGFCGRFLLAFVFYFLNLLAHRGCVAPHPSVPSTSAQARGVGGSLLRRFKNNRRHTFSLASCCACELLLWLPQSPLICPAPSPFDHSYYISLWRRSCARNSNGKQAGSTTYLLPVHVQLLLDEVFIVLQKLDPFANALDYFVQDTKFTLRCPFLSCRGVSVGRCALRILVRDGLAGLVELSCGVIPGHRRPRCRLVVFASVDVLLCSVQLSSHSSCLCNLLRSRRVDIGRFGQPRALYA